MKTKRVNDMVSPRHFERGRDTYGRARIFKSTWGDSWRVELNLSGTLHYFNADTVDEAIDIAESQGAEVTEIEDSKNTNNMGTRHRKIGDGFADYEGNDLDYERMFDRAYDAYDALLDKGAKAVGWRDVANEMGIQMNTLNGDDYELLKSAIEDALIQWDYDNTELNSLYPMYEGMQQYNLPRKESGIEYHGPVKLSPLSRETVYVNRLPKTKDSCAKHTVSKKIKDAAVDFDLYEEVAALASDPNFVGDIYTYRKAGNGVAIEVRKSSYDKMGGSEGVAEIIYNLTGIYVNVVSEELKEPLAHPSVVELVLTPDSRVYDSKKIKDGFWSQSDTESFKKELNAALRSVGSGVRQGEGGLQFTFDALDSALESMGYEYEREFRPWGEDAGFEYSNGSQTLKFFLRLANRNERQAFYYMPINGGLDICDSKPSISDSKRIKDEADTDTDDVIDGILIITFKDGSQEDGLKAVQEHANEQGDGYETYEVKESDGKVGVDMCAKTTDPNAFVKELLTSWGVIDAVADVDFKKSDLMKEAEQGEVSDSKVADASSLKMPKKWSRSTANINGVDYTISHEPTGFGGQQKRNGTFSLSSSDGYFQDDRFNYGDTYGGYISPRDAFQTLRGRIGERPLSDSRKVKDDRYNEGNYDIYTLNLYDKTNDTDLWLDEDRELYKDYKDLDEAKAALHNLMDRYKNDPREILGSVYEGEYYDAESGLVQGNIRENIVYNISNRDGVISDSRKVKDSTYGTRFRLEYPVNDFDAADEFLHSEDMTQYLIDDLDYLGLQHLNGKITLISWELANENEGVVFLKTTEPLAQEDLDKISDWVRGQNADGLGESFEQQDFAQCYADPEYEYDEDGQFDYYPSNEGEFLGMASFDWKTNPYTFKKVQDSRVKDDCGNGADFIRNVNHTEILRDGKGMFVYVKGKKKRFASSDDAEAFIKKTYNEDGSEKKK